MKFKHVLVAVTVPVVLVAAGCSNDKESSNSPETTAKGPSSKSTTTTTTAVAATPVKATGTAMGSSPAAGADTSKLNIAQIAAGTPDVSTLTRLVILGGLLPTVRDQGPFTVFAPVNDAFGAVDPATVLALRNDTTLLQSVLTLHVVPGKLTTADLKKADGTSLQTVNGGKLKVEVKGKDIFVGGAKIIIPDIPAKNGQVQVVDAVIAAPNG